MAASRGLHGCETDRGRAVPGGVSCGCPKESRRARRPDLCPAAILTTPSAAGRSRRSRHTATCSIIVSAASRSTGTPAAMMPRLREDSWPPVSSASAVAGGHDWATFHARRGWEAGSDSVLFGHLSVLHGALCCLPRSPEGVGRFRLRRERRVLPGLSDSRFPHGDA